MITDTAIIHTYFAKLGLDAAVADLYLALYTHGPQNISELSRNARIERTRVYRLIETLLSSNLIEVESHYKRGIIKAAPIANLHILIAQREEELKNLQDELGMIEQILGRNSLSSPATRVQFYQGPEGAKQMFWNQTKAKGPTIAILERTMQAKTGKTFFERWVHAYNENQNSARVIGSDSFFDSLKDWRTKHDTERISRLEQRYVAPEVYTISHDTIVYDNVVAYSNWKEGEIFGIEVYNPEIANSQRQLFELLWKQTAAAPVT